MLVIDGSHGEGGGQILRTALALSLVTQTPCRIERIRAGRAKPGLLRQHLTAAQAAAAIGCMPRSRGYNVGSMQLTFKPKAVTPGSYAFQVGTAGSAMLVLQTVLPALMLANGPSTLHLRGRHAQPGCAALRFFSPGVSAPAQPHGAERFGLNSTAPAFIPLAAASAASRSTRRPPSRRSICMIAGLCSSDAPAVWWPICRATSASASWR